MTNRQNLNNIGRGMPGHRDPTNRGNTAPPPYTVYDEANDAPGLGPWQFQRTQNLAQRRQESSPLNADFPRHGYHTRPPVHPVPQVQRPKNKAWTVSGSTYIWAFVATTYVMWLVLSCVQTARVASLNHRLASYPPTRPELDALEAEWARERTEHKKDYDTWAHDRRAFKEERSAWRAAREEHDADKVNWAQQRRAYEDDTARWQRAMQDHESAKVGWAEEQAGWARERERSERAWRDEREGWARERARREREWREEAGRHRVHEGNVLGLAWQQVESHQCVRYGMRAYTARLGFDMQEACQHMPVLVNGAPVTAPHECITEGDTVVGRWNIGEDETACRPSWGDMYDKGCIGEGSGKRRFEARLWNLHGDEDWMGMCATTPVDLRGQHFDGPLHCENRGVLYGMVGMWDVDDHQCT